MVGGQALSTTYHEQFSVQYCCIFERSHQTHSNSLVRYSPGDIVMFHPVLERVGQLRTHLNLLHVDKPNPFVLLNKDSYQAFGLEQGKL